VIAEPPIIAPMAARGCVRWGRIATCALFAAGVAAVPGAADSGSLAAPLCGVLKGVSAKTRGSTPEIARAQLVMSLAAAFDQDATKLKQARAQIDEATSRSCPQARAAMLEATKTNTLVEAIE